MAIKIFCNQCQSFIKDATPNEISKLKGDEICQGCKDVNGKIFVEVEAIRNDAIDKIRKLSGDYLAKLDEAMRKAIRG
jgi:hypothetical protein